MRVLGATPLHLLTALEGACSPLYYRLIINGLMTSIMNNKITLLITLILWGLLLIFGCKTESDDKHVKTSFDMLKSYRDVLSKDSIFIGGDNIVDLAMWGFPENDPLIVLYDRKIPQDIFFISQKNFHPKLYYDPIQDRNFIPLFYWGRSPYKSWTHFELDRYLNHKFSDSIVPEKIFSELTEKICRFSGEPFAPISNNDSLMAILADTTSYLSALNKLSEGERADVKRIIELLDYRLRHPGMYGYLKIYKFEHSIRVFDLTLHLFLSSSYNSNNTSYHIDHFRDALYGRVYYDYTEFVVPLNRTWR